MSSSYSNNHLYLDNYRKILTMGLSAAALMALPISASAQSDGDGPENGLSDSALEENAQGDVSITIYTNGQALVQDKRNLNLRKGRSRQAFPDVSARIRSETVTLSGPGISIVEQNFDYDLLTPAKLMEKAVGQTVTLIRTNPATGAETRLRAKVLAANGGVVLQIGNSIEVLRDDGLPVRVIFDKVPPNLRARPTLSVTLQSLNGGPTPTKLSYLTGNMGWSADYVTLFDEVKQTIDVQGWVTLTNNTGTSFRDANILLVAGNAADNSQGIGQRFRGAATIEQAGTESNDRERLGDFYLYPLANRTTVANAQQKQVSFMDVKGAPARNTYEYNLRGFQNIGESSASSVLKFTTSRSGGLGDQLPQGTMRVYMQDQRGDPQFIGESNIEATPMGSSMSIRTGDAFDVKVKTIVAERERVNSRRWKTSMRYELSNARDNAITVDLGQSGLWGDVNIINQMVDGQNIAGQSGAGERVSADRMEWQVPVPAKGRTILTVTFDTRY